MASTTFDYNPTINTTAVVENGIFHDGYITYFGISISIYVALASLLCCCSSILLVTIGICVLKLRRRKRDVQSLRQIHNKMVHHDRVATKSKSKLIAIDMEDDEEKEPISQNAAVSRRSVSRARSSRKRRYKKRLSDHRGSEHRGSEHKDDRAQSDAMTSDGEAMDLEADEFVVSSEDTDSNPDQKEEPILNHRKITDFGDDRDDPNQIPDNLMNRNWRRNGKVTKGADDASSRPNKVSSDAMSAVMSCKSEGLAATGTVRGHHINPKDEELSTTNELL